MLLLIDLKTLLRLFKNHSTNRMVWLLKQLHFAENLWSYIKVKILKIIGHQTLPLYVKSQTCYLTLITFCNIQSNLCTMAPYILVTLCIMVTRQLPKN